MECELTSNNEILITTCMRYHSRGSRLALQIVREPVEVEGTTNERQKTALVFRNVQT